VSALRPERSGREASPSFILVDALGAPDSEFTLPENEARYVSRVCRARTGEFLSATDGRGSIAELELLEVGREVRARIGRIERIARGRECTVWCGSPEGERADWLIEKLAELGVGRFQPLDTDRARWKAEGTRAERWRRLAVAALKQSRQGWLMEILPPVSLIQRLEETPADSSCWLADPDGAPAPAAGGSFPSLGAIGPAQGFSSGEKSRLRARGFKAMSLASGRLRTETAALAWAAWWASGGSTETLGDSKPAGA
jgi:16S rRNA (uracil1498-N3)-methyltransferase